MSGEDIHSTLSLAVQLTGILREKWGPQCDVMDMSTSGAGTVHFQGLTSAAVALALACGRPAFVTKAQIQLGRQDGGDPKPKPQTLSPKAVAVQT